MVLLEMTGYKLFEKTAIFNIVQENYRSTSRVYKQPCQSCVQACVQTLTISSPLTFITETRIVFNFPTMEFHFSSPRRSTRRDKGKKSKYYSQEGRKILVEVKPKIRTIVLKISQYETLCHPFHTNLIYISSLAR